MNQTLRYVWGEYRAWAMTSRELKARVQRVSLVVLGLMIGGTALGTLSPLLGGAGALASASDASFIGRLPPPWREVAHLLVSAVPWLAAVALGSRRI
jgi:hypothetical protein